MSRRRKPPKIYHAYRGKRQWKNVLWIVLAVLVLAAVVFAVDYFGLIQYFLKK